MRPTPAPRRTPRGRSIHGLRRRQAALTHDTLVPPYRSRHLHRNTAGSSCAEIASGHAAAIEKPDEFVRVVRVRPRRGRTGGGMSGHLAGGITAAPAFDTLLVAHAAPLGRYGDTTAVAR